MPRTRLKQYVNTRLSDWWVIWNSHNEITIASPSPHFLHILSPTTCFSCISPLQYDRMSGGPAEFKLSATLEGHKSDVLAHLYPSHSDD